MSEIVSNIHLKKREKCSMMSATDNARGVAGAEEMATVRRSATEAEVEAADVRHEVPALINKGGKTQSRANGLTRVQRRSEGVEAG